MHCSPPRICWLRRDSRGCNRRSASSRPSGVDGSRNDAVPGRYKAQLEQAIARKEADEAQLDRARRDLDRYAKLAPLDYTSKITLDATSAQVAQFVAQVAGDQASIDYARTQLEYTTITSPINGRTGIPFIDAV